MATDNVDDKGSSKPNAGEGLNQDDAKALEHLDVAEANKDSDPRLAMMERARKTRAEQMGVELKEDEDKDDAPGARRAAPKEGDAKGGEEGDAAVVAAAEAGEGGEGAAAAATNKNALPDDTEVEITVNGKPEKMTLGEAKKRLQLGGATEETLRQAKETREAANRELEAAAALRKVMGDAAPAKPVVNEPTAAEKRATDIKAAQEKKTKARREFAKAAQYGTAEEVEKATTELDTAEQELDDLRFSQVQPAQTEQRDQLLDREVADTNRGTSEYVKKFGEDQKDPLFRAAVTLYLREENIADLTKLGADENLLRKLDDKELGEHHFRARSRGLVRTVDKVLDAAGSKAREELKRRSAPATPAANARDERQSRKENAPGQPRAAAGRIPEPAEEQRPSGKDLVAEALKRRGKA